MLRALVLESLVLAEANEPSLSSVLFGLFPMPLLVQPTMAIPIVRHKAMLSICLNLLQCFWCADIMVLFAGFFIFSPLSMSLQRPDCQCCQLLLIRIFIHNNYLSKY